MTAGSRTVVVLVEDDEALRVATAGVLADVVSEVQHCATGEAALAAIMAEPVSLVILDLGLPDMDGRDVCTQIRRWSNIPVLVVSARESEAEKVSLLESGADDYIVKPFGVPELVARVQALLRRSSMSGLHHSVPVLSAGGVQVDIAQRRVLRDGEAVRLTPIEWSLLEALARVAGRTLTHQQLFEQVWNREFGNPQQYLRVYMTHLRRKIEPDSTVPRWIITDPGVGYRLEPEG